MHPTIFSQRMKDFGVVFKRIREARKVPVSEVQRDTGVSGPTIYAIEKGQKEGFNIATISQLADWAGIDMGGFTSPHGFKLTTGAGAQPPVESKPKVGEKRFDADSKQTMTYKEGWYPPEPEPDPLKLFSNRTKSAINKLAQAGLFGMNPEDILRRLVDAQVESMIRDKRFSE